MRQVLLAGVVVLIVLGSASTWATDIPITSKKLLVKTEPATATRRFVLKSVQDPAIVAAADPTAGGATLYVAGLSCGAGPGCTVIGSSGSIHLPAAKWVGVGNPAGSRGYRYTDGDGTAGGVKRVVFKGGTLVVVARGAGWPWLPAGSEDGATVTFESGSERYCAEFAGPPADAASGLLVYRDVAAASQCRALCGNDALDAGEQCDGADAESCPGLCLGDCMCPVCGNNVREPGEQCDGADAAWCAAGFSLECNAGCQCCTRFGDCSFNPCCDPEATCDQVRGGSVCNLGSGIGGFCAYVPPIEVRCANGLFCEPEQEYGTGITGTCCSPAACAVDTNCCFGGSCNAGTCCTDNGRGCGSVPTGAGGHFAVIRCCAGLVCCNGASCPDLDALALSSTLFGGTCCGDVGAPCAANAECCSDTCNTLAGTCL